MNAARAATSLPVSDDVTGSVHVCYLVELTVQTPTIRFSLFWGEIVHIKEPDKTDTNLN